MTEKLNHARVPRRFYILTLLIFVPIFYCLLAIRAHWYGWAIAVVAFAGLVAIRRSRFWRGWHAPLCFTLAFLAAYAGLSLSRPRWDVSLPGQIGGGTVWLFTHLPAEEKVTAGMMGLSVWRPPEGYRMETVQLPASTMEALMPEGEKSGWAVLQLHGGAFVSGVNDLYRMMAVRYSSLAGGACVYTLNYRLWPQYPYPSQQNDAMDAWVYLTGTAGYAADHIFVVGDSAGGNLALSLTLRLRDEGRELPAGIVAMSPWADLSNSGPSHLYNATKDPSFGGGPGQGGRSPPRGGRWAAPRPGRPVPLPGAPPLRFRKVGFTSHAKCSGATTAIW